MKWDFSGASLPSAAARRGWPPAPCASPSACCTSAPLLGTVLHRVGDDSCQCSRSRSSSSKWEIGRDAGVGGLTLCLHEGALQALVLQAAVPRGLQLHAKLFVLHQGPLLLRTLLLELRLQAVDLGLELRDVVLSLNGTYETEVMLAGNFLLYALFSFLFLLPVSMLATKNKSCGSELF